jgi:hypothetical protein
MSRRATVLGAGRAMTASAGFVGAGSASAAVPAREVQHIKPGSKWTFAHAASIEGVYCEVDTFAANHTFTDDRSGESGAWSGNGKRIVMTWTSGGPIGGGGGIFVSSDYDVESKEHFGDLNGAPFNSLSKRAQAGC